MGRASAFEFRGSLGLLRVVSISEHPGDTSDGALIVSGGMSVAAITFSVQAPVADGVTLQPGCRYYFNLRNLDPSPGVVYPAAVEIAWPR